MRINGEMNIYAAMELKARLLDLLGDAEQVEVNLSEVNEFDSAGLQVVLWFVREAVERRVKVRFVEPSVVVEELVDLYNLRPATGMSGGE